MKKKKISQYQLINMGVDRKTMDALRHDRNVTVITIEKICMILNCTANDVVEFIND